MRLAVFSDIHGNLPAFNAVTTDMYEHEPDGVVCLGDISFNGLYPQECVELLEHLRPMCIIKGNTDSNFEEFPTFVPLDDAERRLYALIAYGDSRLSGLSKHMLERLPLVDLREIDGKRVLFCHGSPWSFKDNFSPSSPAFPMMTQKVDALDVDVIFCGHTHKRETFEIGRTLVVNVGAVGYAFDGDPRPNYCIADISSDGISINMRRIDYDYVSYREELLADPLFTDLAYVVAYGRFH